MSEEKFNPKIWVENLPQTPGIYVMYNKENIVIYIGKAKNLKKRVSQYFMNKESQNIKTIKLVENIHRMEYIVTDTEEESLILECNFIKRYRPRYNILLRDDKTYPYIRVTTSETYPRILYTRYLEKDGSKYYGPFPDTEYAKGIIEILLDIYSLRRCNQKTFKNQDRACLNYDMGMCLAPCMHYIDEDAYRIRVNKAIEFLEGNEKEVLDLLSALMKNYSDELKFEEARNVKDKIMLVKRISEDQKINTTDDRRQDMIALARSSIMDKQVLQIFVIRDGKLVERKHYLFEEKKDVENSEIISSFLKQYYLENIDLPSEILLEEECSESDEIERTILHSLKKRVKILVPKQGRNKKLLRLASKNAEILLDQNVKAYQTKKEKHKVLSVLAETLGISNFLERIEAYDISNISGVDNVGSMVVFTNGEKTPSEYRKFKIKTVEGPNDTACMLEMVSRRFRRYEQEDLKFDRYPDLIIIDGKLQVDAILEKIGLEVPICGLVKDDKHRTSKIYYHKREIELDPTSELYKFLVRIQDEVHRSAIGYFKKVHHKNLFKSELDKIPGIGEKRKMKLLETYKSIEEIRQKDVEELAKLPGMNQKVAQILKEELNKK